MILRIRAKARRDLDELRAKGLCRLRLSVQALADLEIAGR